MKKQLLAASLAVSTFLSGPALAFTITKVKPQSAQEGWMMQFRKVLLAIAFALRLPAIGP